MDESPLGSITSIEADRLSEEQPKQEVALEAYERVDDDPQDKCPPNDKNEDSFSTGQPVAHNDPDERKD